MGNTGGAAPWSKDMLVVLLDEMNLAPVEQYFAEYLSVVESRKATDEGVVTDPILRKSIEPWYFNLCAELTSDVKEIGFYAFEAQPITSVAIPESVAVIGEGAFIDCASLGSIRLPSALKTIEMGAFAGCSALTEMTIPAGVKEIKRGAFAGCGSMKSLVIESSELGYGEWGIEDLPDLTVYAAEGSAASEWAGNMGKYSVIEEK